jgi:hypothetical protein
MGRLVILSVVVILIALPAGASNAVSLGYSEETTIIGPGTDACASGVLIYNHDGSFETGLAWQYTGCVPPYYGALGEGYDLGAGTIACAAFWLTTIPGFYTPDNADCYVWEDGVSGAPGAVLAMLTSPRMTNIPNWPAVGQNDVEMGVPVTAPFTMGYWGPWPEGLLWYFCAADQNGPGGHPWTCIAPGIGYPSGWQDPSIVGGYWSPTRSMGIGVYFEQATPVESETWGAVKALFR